MRTKTQSSHSSKYALDCELAKISIVSIGIRHQPTGLPIEVSLKFAIWVFCPQVTFMVEKKFPRRTRTEFKMTITKIARSASGCDWLALKVSFKSGGVDIR